MVEEIGSDKSPFLENEQILKVFAVVLRQPVPDLVVIGQPFTGSQSLQGSVDIAPTGRIEIPESNLGRVEKIDIVTMRFPGQSLEGCLHVHVPGHVRRSVVAEGQEMHGTLPGLHGLVDSRHGGVHLGQGLAILLGRGSKFMLDPVGFREMNEDE